MIASVGVTGIPIGCSSNHSKFLQKSKIVNDSFLPFGSHSLCSQILLCLVPRPIICQNLIGDLMGLIKTRLQTSGISTPVSKIPTEIAIRGKDFFLKSLISSFFRLSSWVITRTNSPLYCGYNLSNSSSIL